VPRRPVDNVIAMIPAHRARCLDCPHKPGAGVILMSGADVGVPAIALAAARWLERRFGKSMGEHASSVFSTTMPFCAVPGAGAFGYQRDLAETRLAALADALAKAIGAGASRADEVSRKVVEIGAAAVRGPSIPCAPPAVL
jgi:hypothetical protein